MSSRSNTSSDVGSSGEDDSSDEFYDAPEASGTLLSMARRYNTDRSQDRIDLTTLPPEALDSSGSEVYLSPELKVTLVKKPEESQSLDSVTSDDSSSCDKNRTLTNIPSDVLDSSYGDGNTSMQSASEKSLTKDKDAEIQEESRRKRMEEMRRRLNMEDEPPQDETSPSDSQTSSVEGVYGATSSTSRVSHPFKVVDHDTVSMQSGVSIGRSGRLISVTTPTTTMPPPLTPVTSTVPSNLSRTSSIAESSVVDSGAAKVSAFVPEPDLVTSCVTKDAGKAAAPPVENFVIKMPVAPPRRKRQPRFSDVTRPGDLSFGSSVVDSGEKFGFSRQASDSSAGSLQSPQPPSPTVSIRSTTRELDKTLESGAQKFWVVKPQDTQESRAKSSGPKVLRRTESLPKEMMSALDPSGTGSLERYSSHSNSNSNSSTLNTSHGLNTSLKEMPVDAEVSQPAPAPTSRGNTGPINQHLSHLVSSLAAEEEKRERDLHLNPFVRTRTDSGKLLSDQEILDQVTVLNLDTGERIPLSSAEDQLPKCLNPLSLHIMRLTSEYIDSSHAKERDSDDESIDSKKSSAASQEDADGTGKVVRKKTAQIKRFIGTTVKKTVDKAKSLAHPRTSKEDHDINTNDDLLVGGQDPLVKMRASHSHKGPYDFDHLQQVQDLTGEFSHSGPVWCMKFSNCSKLLASAGQDGIIRIWVLKDHLNYFQDMRSKHTVDKVSPTPSQESIVSQHSHHSAEEMASASENSDPRAPFVPRPLCVYRGHQADVLDLAWSKSYFLLSSSMDRTVRLWHISRRECLCCFQHIDFVTAIAFHPRDDRYFLSGSLDGKLRLWNIPDKKVALWNEVTGPNNLITTANFCQGGKFAVVGTYDGRCIFYHTEQLKYHTQIIVHRRKKVAGRKITGIEPIPGEEKILVTCNDSRIRLYDLRDLGLTCKYKGCVNSSSQIKATISHDGKYIVSGSENQCVYIWKTYHDYSKFSSARRDRNGFWEAIRAHNAVVTCAIFSPDPDIIVKQIEAREKETEEAEDDGSKPPPAVKTQSGFVKSPTLTKSQNISPYTPTGYVLVSADFAGCIKVFLSKVKPKHSSLPASAMA